MAMTQKIDKPETRQVISIIAFDQEYKLHKLRG